MKKESTGFDLNDFNWEEMILEASIEKMQEDGQVVTEEEKKQLREMIREQWTNKKD